jgi:hypothetical protein
MTSKTYVKQAVRTTSISIAHSIRTQGVSHVLSVVHAQHDDKLCLRKAEYTSSKRYVKRYIQHAISLHAMLNRRTPPVRTHGRTEMFIDLAPYNYLPPTILEEKGLHNVREY